MSINRLAVSRDPVFAPKQPSTSSFSSFFQRTSSAPPSGPLAASSFAAPPPLATSASKPNAPGAPKKGQAQGQGRYRALVNRVRKERLKRLAILSWLAVHVVLYVSLLDGFSTLFSLISLSLPLATSIIWAGAVGPIVLLKALERSRRKERSDTRYAHFYRLFASLNAVQVLVVSLIAAVAVWAGFVFGTLRLQPDATMGPFVTVRGRNMLQYNERPFYLLFAQLVLSFVYGTSYIARERGVVPLLASPDCPPIKTRIIQRLGITVPASVRLVACSSLISLLAYLPIRRIVLPYLVLSPIGAHLFRPRLIAVLRRNAAVSLGIQWRVLMEGMVFVVVWEVVSVLWEVYDTHPREVVRFDKEPNKALLDGLLDPKTQHMALLELAQIAAGSSEGRLRIFSDIRGNPRPFNAMAKECLRIVDETRQLTDGKGALPTPSSTAGPPPSTHVPQQARPHAGHSPLKTGVNVFQPPPKKSFFSRLLSSDDPSSAPISSTASAVSSTVTAASSSVSVDRLPSLFRSASAPPSVEKRETGPSQSAPPPPQPKLREAELLQNLAPELVKRSRQWGWLFETLWAAKVARCIPDAPACILAVDALSKLLSASLKEDPYGTAQSEIVPAFESFVTCLDAVEALEADLQKTAKTPRDEERLRDAVWHHLRPLQTSLSAGIALMLNTFAPYTHEMQFSNRVAKRLSSMIAIS